MDARGEGVWGLGEKDKGIKKKRFWSKIEKK